MVCVFWHFQPQRSALMSPSSYKVLANLLLTFYTVHSHQYGNLPTSSFWRRCCRQWLDCCLWWYRFAAILQPGMVVATPHLSVHTSTHPLIHAPLTHHLLSTHTPAQNITFQTGSTVTLSPASWRLSWEWFILSYQFFILVLIGVLGVMKKLRKMHSALNSQLAFVSVLWAIIANNFYQLVRRFDSTEFANALDSAGLYPSVRYDCALMCG